MNDPSRSTDRPVTGFDFNRPTIIALLYLASFITGITAVIGIVLAHIWANEPGEAWGQSHYRYLIRTFWLALAAGAVGVVLTIVLVGFAILFAVTLWVAVRSVVSLVKAQKREPLADPATLLF
ncbi:DUF4870 family protein [Sphingomonas cavernae]|uniref:DUF4870 domain-containing protein n=1 Tax=Sphingomonas cavernae TaxID=2320861 RepID=A0A418WS46_9SPHN|nr:hypothetical protein [Sphingomonas cavernae]RJF94083.1 hypothetical protein D3876_07445 [Sphingomonas cavernae]